MSHQKSWRSVTFCKLDWLITSGLLHKFIQFLLLLRLTWRWWPRAACSPRWCCSRRPWWRRRSWARRGGRRWRVWTFRCAGTAAPPPCWCGRARTVAAPQPEREIQKLVSSQCRREFGTIASELGQIRTPILSCFIPQIVFLRPACCC